MTASPAAAPILPGATVGILGGGQLGRMLAVAARRLGYGVAIWAPEPDAPAAALADLAVREPYDDPEALARFAAAVDVVTLEFENVPAATAAALAAHVPVRPDAATLAITQDRGREKRLLADLGIPVAPFALVPDREALDAAMGSVGLPAVLKTTGLGYDGKGQCRLDDPDDLAAAHALLASGPCILEAHVDLALELSVLVARGPSGELRAFPPCENAHHRHVLDVTVVPARVSAEVATAATRLALRVVEGLDAIGLVAVECFLARDGTLLANELAPRPHNSGHVTLEACETDQFEQLLRAVCGLPLGATALRRPAAMANLLGDLWSDAEPAWPEALARPGVHLHLYGKRAARPGRKMGHLTALADDADGAERQVRSARSALARAKGEG
jgi:5-(carboxyamino)imidazole ribonucleotide synthase